LKILEEGKLAEFVRARYSSFDAGDGARFERGELSLENLAAIAGPYGTLGIKSGKQERLENLITASILKARI
jgi:xylose isomerase